jgi:hypothetical protein
MDAYHPLLSGSMECCGASSAQLIAGGQRHAAFKPHCHYICDKTNDSLHAAIVE